MFPSTWECILKEWDDLACGVKYFNNMKNMFVATLTDGKLRMMMMMIPNIWRIESIGFSLQLCETHNTDMTWI